MHPINDSHINICRKNTFIESNLSKNIIKWNILKSLFGNGFKK